VAVLTYSLGFMVIARPSPAEPPPSTTGETFRIREVAQGVFVHFGRHLALNVPGHDDIANIGFVVGSRCVAVIDTGGSVNIGRALSATVKQHTQVPICYVINTHGHVDHVLGNAAFLADKPQFVGHTRLKGRMTQSRDFFISHYANDLDAPASSDQIIGPDRLVEDSLELDLGTRQLRLQAWPVAHTDNDLTVLDLKTGTFWTGDLLFRERLPAVDGRIPGWLSVLDRFNSMHVRLAIPGHGDITTEIDSALEIERHYLSALDAGVRSELAGGRSMQHAIENVAGTEQSKWLLWPETHPHNVTRVYQQLEWE
jgi:quinoprotein relay system zinc metallohydrolase 2